MKMKKTPRMQVVKMAFRIDFCCIKTLRKAPKCRKTARQQKLPFFFASASSAPEMDTHAVTLRIPLMTTPAGDGQHRRNQQVINGIAFYLRRMTAILQHINSDVREEITELAVNMYENHVGEGELPLLTACGQFEISHS